MENHSKKILDTLATLDLDDYKIYHLSGTPLGVGFCMKLGYSKQNFISIIYNIHTNNYNVKLMRITAKGMFKDIQKFIIDDVRNIECFLLRKQYTYTNGKLIKEGDVFQVNGDRQMWEVVVCEETNKMKFRESRQYALKQNTRNDEYFGTYHFNENSNYLNTTSGRRSTI